MEERTALEEGEDVPRDRQAEQTEEVGVSGGCCLSARLSGREPQTAVSRNPRNSSPGVRRHPRALEEKPLFRTQGLGLHGSGTHSVVPRASTAQPRRPAVVFTGALLRPGGIQ